MNQWINEPVDQSSNQRISEAMNHWTNEPRNQWINDSAHEQMNEWMNWLMGGWMDEWATFLLCWCNSSLSDLFAEAPLLSVTLKSDFTRAFKRSRTVAIPEYLMMGGWRDDVADMMMDMLTMTIARNSQVFYLNFFWLFSCMYIHPIYKYDSTNNNRW
jgi:hypothetical protein